MSVNRRNVLVVGASRGIGLEIANYLADRGYSVTSLARSKRSPKLLNKIKHIEFDLTKNEFEPLTNNFKKSGLHGVVFCAGLSIPSGTKDEITRFRETVESNLIAPFITIFNLSQVIKKYGSVVFLSSINSKQGFSKNPGYVSSKSGLDGLTRALALDLSTKSIRVNSVTLGYFPTDMTINSFKNKKEFERRKQKTILLRWGKLKEIPPAIDFLLSESSSYVTGSTLTIDGGWLAKGI